MSAKSVADAKFKTNRNLPALLSNTALKRKCDCGQHTVAGAECTECGKKQMSLQRASQNSELEMRNAGGIPPMVHGVLNSTGHPLDAATRAFMEPRFGHNFSRVRVHTDARAAESARAMNALAYTQGRNIVLAHGQYSPSTLAGKKLLAHELTHVLQQNAAGPLGIQRQTAETDELKPTTPSEPTPVDAPVAAPVSDPEIDALDLAATAKAGAVELKKNHPGISFTSGRRNVAEQAHAMASNIVSGKDRKWIEKTYASAAALQKWVDDNPKATTVDEISKGLEDTMNGMSSADLGKVSKHLSGEAFDVQPQKTDADAIKKSIKALSGLSKFLEKEGGLVRWHAQFKRAEFVAHADDPLERQADLVAEQICGANDLSPSSSGNPRSLHASDAVVGVQRQVPSAADGPKKKKKKVYGPYVLPEVVVTAKSVYPVIPETVATEVQQKMERFSVREVTFVKVETVEEVLQRLDALNQASSDQLREDYARSLGSVSNADPAVEQQAADENAQGILKEQFGEGWGTFFWWTRGGGQTGEDSPLWGVLEGVSGFNRAAPLPGPGVDPVYRDRTRTTHEIEAGK
jgi:hypothetical protein